MLNLKLKLKKKKNKMIESFFYKNYLQLDAPRPWGLYFQDSAAPQFEGIIELHSRQLILCIRIKLRGSLKVLITKVIEETQ